VAYREALQGTAEAEGSISASGGVVNMVHVWLKIEPRERGEGFRFVDEIVGGKIPKEFIPAVKKGIEEVLETAFWPVIRWWMFQRPSSTGLFMTSILPKLLSSLQEPLASKRRPARPGYFARAHHEARSDGSREYLGGVTGDLNAPAGNHELGNAHGGSDR
jgi:hypothetical protein